jgi:hypothetical protein
MKMMNRIVYGNYTGLCRALFVAAVLMMAAAATPVRAQLTQSWRHESPLAWSGHIIRTRERH